MIAKDGFLADFKIGYHKIANIEHQAEVTGGTDTSYDGKVEGFAVGRLAVRTTLSDGSVVIAPATGVTTTSVGDANCIIAQSDNSLRNFPNDAIPTEQSCNRYQGILGNTATVVPTEATTTMKSVALYKITDADDIKIIPVKPTSTSVVR